MISNPRRRPLKCVPVYRKQEEFCTSSRFITGFCAGRGSGKSLIGCLKILQTAKDGERWMAISPTYRVIEDTTWPTFKDLAERLGVWKGGKTHPAPVARFKTGDKGEASLAFRSAENPDLLRGPSLPGLWFDEASVMHVDAFKYAIPSLRHKGRMGKCFLTFTPKGRRHWTFEVFYEHVGGDGETLAIPGQDGVVEIGGRLFRERSNAQLIRAHTLENPFLAEEYYDLIRSQYSTTLAAQELAGEFVELEGLLFRREWLPLVDAAPKNALRVRYWDRAGTPGGGKYTAGVLMAAGEDGLFYVEDVVRGQWSPGERDRIMEGTAERDARRYGNEVIIYAEQEGGSAGKEISEQFIRRMAGFPVYRDIVSGKRSRIVENMELPGEAKVIRALPLAAQAEGGNVRVVRGKWTEDFLEELCAFPEYAYSDQCLVAGTLVSTRRGEIPIEKVQAGEFVATRSGWRRVEWSGMTNCLARTISVEFESGKMLQGTHQHPIWVEGCGFIPMSCLSPGDFCLWLTERKGTRTEKQSCSMVSSSIGIQNQNGGRTGSITRGIGESEKSLFIKRSGSITTAKFPMDALSTTLTGIRSTTALKTLNASLTRTTNKNTQAGEISQQRKLGATSIRYVIGRRSGIAQRKEGLGILGTQSSKSDNCRSSCASIAERSTRHLTSEQIAFVQRNARIPQDCREKKSTSPSVNFAGRIFSLTSEGADFVLTRVRVSRVTSADLQPVYNLTVNGQPEFFANGVLVHNCDAASGAFAKLSRRGGQPDLSEVQTHDSQPDMSHYGLMLQRSLRREGGLCR